MRSNVQTLLRSVVRLVRCEHGERSELSIEQLLFGREICVLLERNQMRLISYAFATYTRDFFSSGISISSVRKHVENIGLGLFNLSASSLSIFINVVSSRGRFVSDRIIRDILCCRSCFDICL